MDLSRNDDGDIVITAAQALSWNINFEESQSQAQSQKDTGMTGTISFHDDKTNCTNVNNNHVNTVNNDANIVPNTINTDIYYNDVKNVNIAVNMQILLTWLRAWFQKQKKTTMIGELKYLSIFAFFPQKLFFLRFVK